MNRQRRANGKHAALDHLPQVVERVAKRLGGFRVFGADDEPQVAGLLFQGFDPFCSVLHQGQQRRPGLAEDLHRGGRTNGRVLDLRDAVGQQFELLVRGQTTKVRQSQAELRERVSCPFRSLCCFDQKLLHLADADFERLQVGSRLLGRVSQLRQRLDGDAGPRRHFGELIPHVGEDVGRRQQWGDGRRAQPEQLRADRLHARPERLEPLLGRLQPAHELRVIGE